ncbi:TlpA disulfide reductase family protein [Bosea sp. CS1GBMeth4]|uniref:thiol:disulfide interchange protein TlpA n=1 Tax=Bosea sp. CS1GBMeth4 TaxID=1892849 RepID=UPI001FCF244E|nr:TlpA disulfide reductase family protein [Bosea sp. CS1GBMeth4]
MTSRSKMMAACGALALLVIGGAAAFYSVRGGAGNSTCSAAGARAEALRPLARGEVAAVEVAKQPALIPDLAFNGPDGEPTTLSAFRGKTVLVNLWATWCLPCLTEMPALDALQGALGGSDFEVVAINIDTRHPDKPKKWLADKNIVRLGYYADPQAKVFQDIRAVKKVEGMPISLLVDPAGCELALLQGPAEWSGADARTLITAAIGRR